MATELQHHHRTLHAADDHEIQVQSWTPVGEPKVVVQVLHGLGEYADRYARFAQAAAERGVAVCAHNHRGHGSETSHRGYLADKNGWHALVGDTRVVNQFVHEEFDSTPVVMLGHSMGSYVAQNYAMHYGSELSALILSASTWPRRPLLFLSYALAGIERWRVGGHLNSHLLDQLGFGRHNRAFRPARTELDWLSRDTEEVDKYIADPLCGGPYTPRLWLDVLGGLIEISNDNALLRIPASLPILITGGESDPVGGDKGMTRLLQHYAQTSHQRLKARIYPAGRHEMLNETNRDEVTRDWLDWIETTTRSAHSN